MKHIPPGYRPQSPDTTYEAEQVLFELYRNMPPWKKLERVFDLTTTMHKLAVKEMQRQTPELSEQQAWFKLLASQHGCDFIAKAYKIDPDSLK